MKKYFILLIILVFTGCFEDSYVDPTIMPEETTTGANTFGCLIDGWLYTGGRYLNTTIFILDVTIDKSILFYYQEEEDIMYVSVKVSLDDSIEFQINNPQEGKARRLTNLRWKRETLNDCDVYITRFDPAEQIISGRFFGGRIEHGRFDVRYDKASPTKP